jgi:hypothetical protein
MAKKAQYDHPSLIRWKKLLLPLLAIVLVAGIIVLCFYLYTEVQIKGPSGIYIRHNNAAQVNKEASATKDLLQTKLSAVSFPNEGFKLVSSGYTDACYPSNSGGSQKWQKLCYGRAVNYYASKLSPASTVILVLENLANRNWQPTAPGKLNSTCLGFPSSVITNSKLGFSASYKVSSLKDGCSLSETVGDSVSPYVNLSSIQYSSLTRTINQPSLIKKLKAEGYNSFIMIVGDKQYYSKPAGRYYLYF